MKLAYCLPLLLSLLTACAAPGDTPSQQRGAIQAMRSDTLGKLYKLKPEVRKEIRSAAGYAVFSNINNNLLFVSSGNGYGVAMPENAKPLPIGKGRIIREGTDIAILSYGTRLQESLKAAEILSAQGLSATVADARFARPLDAEAGFLRFKIYNTAKVALSDSLPVLERTWKKPPSSAWCSMAQPGFSCTAG